MTSAALQITNLHKQYANGTTAIQPGFNLTVQTGDFLALLGPNGAGKSTLIGIITGLINKTSGSIKVSGIDTDQYTSLAKKQLGLVPQEVNLNIFETCQQTLMNQAAYYGIPRGTARKRANELLEKFQLKEKSKQPTRFLSGGMKRRLMIARALIHRPKILILDEPTAGVDVDIRHSIWSLLTELNQHDMTILLTTHYLEEAERLSKHTAIINHGVLIKQEKTATIINKLDSDSIILNLTTAHDTLPTLPNWQIKQTSPHTLEVNIKKNQTISDLILDLSQHQILVRDFSRQTNRLEQIFINMIKTNEQEVGA